MPLAFLFDENQRGLLWRAALRHNRNSTDLLDIVRVGDPIDLPRGTLDPEILVWAENANRILVTFDKATMAAHLAAHLQTGRHSPGILCFAAAAACRKSWRTWRWPHTRANRGSGRIGSNISHTEPTPFLPVPEVINEPKMD